MRNNKFFLLFLGLLIGAFFTFFPISRTQAASLFLSPSTGNYNVGSNFSVSLYVNSSDQAANAVTAQINFPQDKLSVASISRSGSVINFWPEEPSFNNSKGVISLSGVALNPGFSGKSGKIVTISFKVKETGKIGLSLSSAQVLANDGLGTNIFKGASGAQFTLDKEEPTIVPITVSKPAPGVNTNTNPKPAPKVDLGAPLIASETNPEPDLWYPNNSPVFSWSLPSGTQSVGLAIDNNPDTVPGFIAKNVLSHYQVNNIADGTWFLHVQFRLSKDWTKISHFRFNVDTSPPLFTDVNIKNKEVDFKLPKDFIFDFSDLNNLINQNVQSAGLSGESGDILNIEAVDDLSGVAKYEVSVNGQEPVVLSPEAKEFPLGNLPAGSYEAEIKVYDKAGNYTSLIKKLNVSRDSSEFYLNVLNELKRSHLQAAWVIVISLIIFLLLIINLIWRHFKLADHYRAIRKNRDNGVIRVDRKLAKKVNVATKILSNIKKRRPLTDDEDKLLLLVSGIKNFHQEYFEKDKAAKSSPVYPPARDPDQIIKSSKEGPEINGEKLDGKIKE